MMTNDMTLYTLKNGSFTAVINLSRGANCISLRQEALGACLLREPTYAEGEHPFLYGMPLLFPVNRISGGGFTFEGRDYRFPINEESTGCHLHGVLHAHPFSLIEGDGTYAVCLCHVDGSELYPSFPHTFEIRITYRLEADGLTQLTEITNLSDTAMPCLIGYHTTFCVPFIRGGEVRVTAQLSQEYARGADYLPTGEIPEPDEVMRALTTDGFDPLSRPISRHCRAGGTGRMVLEDIRHGQRVVYENDEAWRFRLIYNGDADGFLCLEPQNCMVDAPNNVFGRKRSGFDAIEPGAKRCFRSAIRLEQIPLATDLK